MKLNTRVSPDIDSLSRAALEQVLADMQEAVKLRRRFAIALSGGHTPSKMYALWAQNEKYRTETPWDRVHLFWGDERYVPSDDPLSNYRMTRETLISHVPIPAANVHPAPTNLPTPQAAATAYDADLHQFFGSAPPAFDVTLLGVGPEGHTASLFPGSPALEEKKNSRRDSRRIPSRPQPISGGPDSAGRWPRPMVPRRGCFALIFVFAAPQMITNPPEPLFAAQ